VNATLQLLRAGTQRFAVFTDQIAAIAAWREPTPLPHAPKAVLGVVALEGRMLTVLELAQLSTRPADQQAGPCAQLVALRGDEQLALAVTAVAETIELNATELAALETSDSEFPLGVLERNGEQISIVNTKELFLTALRGRERRQRRF
jgi:purine-binding chemotaxis protein CheW